MPLRRCKPVFRLPENRRVLKKTCIMAALAALALSVQAKEPVQAAADVFVCHSSNMHFAVSEQNGSMVYSAWPRRGSRNNPSLTLRNGKSSVQGQDACRAAVWYFHNDDYSYTVQRGGCFDKRAPKGVQGRVLIERQGKTVSQFYCRRS